ncbi:MAG: M20 family peptidase [Panacagrimonas sp.]
MAHRIIQAVLTLALVFLIVAGSRLLTVGSPVKRAGPVAVLALDESALAQGLAQAIRIQTVSYPDAARNDAAAISAFHDFLLVRFPRVHASLKREVVGTGSLLFTWTGGNASMSPILLLAHLDVVPVEPGTEARWTHPPFDGVVADGRVWGRGAIDDKASLVALMESAEHLLGEGFTPPRTLMFAFGHDEEIGGRNGAAEIAQRLRERGVQAAFAIDEGGSVTQGVIAGVAAPVASIMVGEKGYGSFRLSTHATGGHSARPPPQTAVGQLARAVARVQDHPLPTRLVAPVTTMMDRLAAEMPLGRRLAVSNRWLLDPLLRARMRSDATSNAMIRTTAAPTVFHAGVKDNVLPGEAYAIINFRLLPGDTLAMVEAHLRRVIGDPGVEVALEGQSNGDPSPVSGTDSPGFVLLERTVNEIFPEAVVAPGLVLGATDLRHYGAVAQARYNFAPLRLLPENLATIHGTDERVGVADYANMVRFYVRLMQNAAG